MFFVGSFPSLVLNQLSFLNKQSFLGSSYLLGLLDIRLQGPMAHNDQGEDDKRIRVRGQGRGRGRPRKRKQPEASHFSTSTLPTDYNNTSNSWSKNYRYGTTFLGAPSLANQLSFKTACTICKEEMDSPMICINTDFLCPSCNHCFLASIKSSVSQNPQPKVPPPLSSTIFRSQFLEIMNHPYSTDLPVYSLYDQYKLALKDPRFFRIMLDLVSIIKNKPLPVPIFQGKELNLHPIFVQVTCRGGIRKVVLERRMQELCAALAANLSAGVLYKMYMKWLYDLESWFFDSPHSEYLQTSSTSFARGHLMQGLLGGQPSSQRIQASAPYRNPASVNTNRQSTSLQAGFDFGLTCHLNSSSSRPCPMPGVIGGQPSSSNLDSAVANNNRLWITEPSAYDYDSDFEYNLDFDFASPDHPFSSLPKPHPIQGLIGGQPSEQGHTSLADLNSAIANDQITFIDDALPGTTSRDFADNTQDFSPADEQSSYVSSDWVPIEWEVQPEVPVPDVYSTDPSHNERNMVGSTESRDGNYEKGASSTGTVTSISAEQQPSNDRKPEIPNKETPPTYVPTRPGQEKTANQSVRLQPS
ncbi:uncharacterized protein [Gossypium hirsutum]|uniref:Uncharacterized protein isoform X3 n=1 Tax=Gossypium hirsutum TaxID=3635 RepID=A0ABM3B533_GOSHI|nr:uncharacterized protein LOC121223781 isoform X3 [Gossypium hirsutum]